jgi:hypothetical protein
MSAVFFLLISCPLLTHAVPYNLLLQRYLDYNWLEFSPTLSQAFDNSVGWQTVTTSSVIPSDVGKVSVFISVPDVLSHISPVVGGSGPTFPVELLPPLVPKIKESPTRNPDGTYSFSYKLIYPGDSNCSTQWTNWRTIPSNASRFVEVMYLVAVEGVYSTLLFHSIKLLSLPP